MSPLRPLLAIFLMGMLSFVSMPIASHAQDSVPDGLQITEVELSPQPGAQRIQWIEFFNPTNDTFVVPITVTTEEGVPTFKADTVTLTPGYSVLTIHYSIPDPRMPEQGELGFPTNVTSLVVYTDGREIGRTPELADAFSDSRTWQYDLTNQRWVFAESTMNWYASNIDERSIDAVTGVSTLVSYEAEEEVFLYSLDWSQDLLVYSAEVDGKTDIWKIDTTEPSTKPQRVDFGKEAFTPVGPRLNHDASKLLFIGSTAPPGPLDALPVLYVSNTDGTALRQIALNVTSADWVNATTILYSQRESMDFSTYVRSLFVFLNLETGDEVVKREYGPLWLAEVSPSGRLALATRPVNNHQIEYVIVELPSFNTRELDVHIPTEQYWGGGYSQQEDFLWAADGSHLFYINPEAFGAISIYQDERTGIYKSDSKVVIRTFDPNNVDYSGNRLAYVANPVLSADGKSLAVLNRGDYNRDYHAQIMLAHLAVAVPEFDFIPVILIGAGGVGGIITLNRFRKVCPI